jgi:hypothetical protein
MNTIEKINLLSDAYVTKDVKDERERMKVINDKLPNEFHHDIMDIQFKLNEITGTFELDYDIMSDACDIICNLTPKELEDAPDFYDLAGDSASAYTSTRLGYLNMNNQADISDKLKEYDCDISDACAAWYDEMVAGACELIMNYVLTK